MSGIVDEIDKQLKNNTKSSNKDHCILVSKKTLHLLKLSKIVLTKPTYDDVIIYIVKYWRDTKLLKKQSS